MKVAIVTDFLLKMGGAERVVKRIADMYPEAPIFTLLYDEKKCGKDFPKSRVRPSFLQRFPRFMRRKYRMLFPLMPYAVEALDLMEYDLVISSSSAFAHGAITSSESVHVCYCHSPMRYAWDYTHRYLGEQREGGIAKWFAKRFLHGVRIWDKVAADRPDFYIANSQHVQKRIEKFYRLPADVIYPPVEVGRFEVAEEKDDYYLILSTLTPYKKIDLAVNLFNRIGKRLVVVGGGPELEFLKTIAGPKVDIKGRLSDYEVKRVLEDCRALIFPSEEDFGISIVEAMACGKPVLAYGVGGALETVIPGKTGELFSEQKLSSMESALGRMIVNENKYKASAIRKHAEQFAADKFDRAFQKYIKEKTKHLPA